MQGTDLVEAKEAFSLPISLGDGPLPDEIQYFPPGRHTITATDSAGKPITRTVNISPATADRMSARFSELRDAAASGAGDLPYIDFNHADAEASAHLLGFRWAGDDPATGGVRAQVRWTGPGEAALKGRAYRRFSPTFSVDADGEVVGAPVNMGGLVNRAAFKTITPIWSREGAPQEGGQVNQPQESTMESNQELADLKAANTDLQKQVTELNAKLATAGQTELIKAKDLEITDLKSQIFALKATNAKAIVDAAVKAGKLPPQATELHAKWTKAITENQDAAEMLNAIAPVEVSGKMTSARAGDEGGNASTNAHRAAELVEDYRHANKCSHEVAHNFIRRKHPELFGL